MKKQIINFVLVLNMFGLALSANATLPTYNFTDLGTLGGTSSYATAINNLGQVTGMAYTNGNSWNSPTLWNDTIATSLDGNVSYASAINNSGQVAGFTLFGREVFCCLGTNYYDRATVWNGTTTNYFNSVGGTNTYAFAINDAGQVAGYSGDGQALVWDGTTTTYLGVGSAYAINNAGQVAGVSGGHATVWNGTIVTDLGTLGGINSTASAINDAGQVVGYSPLAGNNEVHATLWNGTTITDLGTLGGNSYARDINASGLIVGFSNILGGQHATIWGGNTITDLNSFLDASTVAAGWVLTDATGINDNGWIVGSASNSLLGIANHAFVMSVAAVPELNSYAMALIGLGFIGFIARRSNAQRA
jgi:probable HAF family extracellular repeat protein